MAFNFAGFKKEESESEKIIRDVNTKITAEVKEFNRLLDVFAKDLVPRQVLIIQKKMVLELLTRVVLKTPVDTGRARGNWQTTIGSAPEGESGRLDESVSAEDSSSIEAGLKVLAELPPFAVVWISNNLDYISYLENGSSKQAPEGMLAVSIAELQEMFNVDK